MPEGDGSTAAKSVLIFAGLMVALFIVAVVTGATYIGFDKLLEVACEQSSTANTWTGFQCVNITAGNSSEVTLTSVTQIEVVQTSVTLAVGLISLVVVIAVFAIVIAQVGGFRKIFNF